VSLQEDLIKPISSARPATAAARIRSVLRAEIVGMKLTPGEPIAEKELCEQFAVSRTPVREALLSLADEHLIEIRPQIGTFVARISLPAIRDAMVIRRALERVSAREAAARATVEDVRRLSGLLKEQERHTGRDGFFRFHAADEALHQAIADIAGHPNIWRVIRQEKAQVDRGRLLMMPQLRRRKLVVEQHCRIIEAIAAGNPDAAEAAMDDHLKDVLPSFARIQIDYPDYFEDDEENPPTGSAPRRRRRPKAGSRKASSKRTSQGAKDSRRSAGGGK
jgi:DNA-binding GntR family transcriptional regulator